MQTGSAATENWRSDYVLARDAATVGAQAALYRDVKSGLLIPAARGVYQRRESARGTAEARYLARVRGTALALDRPIVFSHSSAAAIWGLPLTNGQPDRVHAVAAVGDGGRSTRGLTVHCVGIPRDTETLSGLVVTSLARTIADVGSTMPLADALVMADAALAGLQDIDSRMIRSPMDAAALDAEIELRGSARGIRQLRWISSFASGGSGSVGESLSRLAMHQVHCPAPILQQEFRDRRGLIGYVDFWWPDFNLIGEFDGQGKYLRDEFTRGRPVADVVMAEKRREDRLRATATHPGVVRWGWAIARSRSLLASRLREAGLPV